MSDIFVIFIEMKIFTKKNTAPFSNHPMSSHESYLSLRYLKDPLELKPKHSFVNDSPTFRDSLCKYLESHRFHTIILLLIITDLILLLIEHIFMIQSCHSDENILEKFELLEIILTYASKIIISIFALEIIAKIYAFGLSFFTPMNLLDFVAVFAGVICEFVVPIYGSEIGIILLLVRIVRLLRFAHAFSEAIGEEKDREIETLEIQLKASEQEIQRLHRLLRFQQS